MQDLKNIKDSITKDILRSEALEQDILDKNAPGFTQTDINQKVELLAPAGNLTKLKIALQYGADAVYGGVSHFSLRNRAGKNFTYEDFREGITYAHSLSKKVYVTINGFPFNSQIESLKTHIAKMRDLSPDAFIVATPGVVRLAKSIAPNIPIHLSTQANVLNVLDAGVYYDMGVKRIVAAREVSLSDCENIKQVLPDLELEIFVHGSMCFAFSGRCLISALQHGRVPNRGSCANDCRFDYEYFVRDSDNGNLVRYDTNELYIKSPDNDVFLHLQEEQGVGTHIFNAKDLNLAGHLHEILQSGVINALKIEGRTKSTYYAGITARTYRLAVNDYLQKISRPKLYQYELHTLKNRGFTDGYIIHRPFARLDTQNHASAISEGSYQVCAEVDESGFYCLCKHTIHSGDLLEIISPLHYYPNTQFGTQSHSTFKQDLNHDFSKNSINNSMKDFGQNSNQDSRQNLNHDFRQESNGLLNQKYNQNYKQDFNMRKESLKNTKDKIQDSFKMQNFSDYQNNCKKDSKGAKDFRRLNISSEISLGNSRETQSIAVENSHKIKDFCKNNFGDTKDFDMARNSNDAQDSNASVIGDSALESNHTRLKEQSSEHGTILCIDGRYYLRLYRILLQNGKELEAIHSGNTNPIALPFKLPPFSFLRIKL